VGGFLGLREIFSICQRPGSNGMNSHPVNGLNIFSKLVRDPTATNNALVKSFPHSGAPIDINRNPVLM